MQFLNFFMQSPLAAFLAILLKFQFILRFYSILFTDVITAPALLTSETD